MPLVHNTVYTIRNDLTHTVLDLPDPTDDPQVVVRGWGWHGRNNQQWKLIQVGASSLNTWKLQNQGVNPSRFLSLWPEFRNRRLVGALANGVAADATFVIQGIAGPSERYRILDRNGRPATLITGGPGDEVHEVPGPRQVLDLYADGPAIAIQDTADENQQKYRAQFWSFLPVAQLPIKDGTYQIVNVQTGLVLDLTVNNEVNGVLSSQANQKWSITKDQNNGSYTFRNSRVDDRFLAHVPGANLTQAVPLHGRLIADAARFTVRKVPGTQHYRIFYDPQVAANYNARALTVNLANAEPSAAPGAVNLSIQTGAQPQTWAFV